MVRPDPYLHPPLHGCANAVLALAEDLTPIGDLSAALLPRDARGEAEFIVRVPGVPRRHPLDETFRQIDERIEVEWTVAEGALISPAPSSCRVRGPLPSILTAARTALNFLVTCRASRHACARSSSCYATPAVDRASGVGIRARPRRGYGHWMKAAVRARRGRNHVATSAIGSC